MGLERSCPNPLLLPQRLAGGLQIVGTQSVLNQIHCVVGALFKGGSLSHSVCVTVFQLDYKLLKDRNCVIGLGPVFRLPVYWFSFL